MRMTLGHFATGIFIATLLSAVVTSAPAADSAADGEKYLLRYQFHSGETLRWDVEHRTRVRTTMSKATETVETLSKSVKVWRVGDVKPDGTAVFEHSVERVEMWQRRDDGDEIRYNSESDAKPPTGFEGVAQSVGAPLLSVTIDPKGKILHRERREIQTPTQTEGSMTIPLPDEAVPVGHTWSHPEDIDISLESGGVKKIKAIQQFTLESVKTGVATIRVSTDILTPISDPAIESQLIQREVAGAIRFDIDAGRILEQQMDVDKHVVGFRGEASSIHYVNRFSEQILPQGSRTAAKVAINQNAGPSRP